MLTIRIKNKEEEKKNVLDSISHVHYIISLNGLLTACGDTILCVCFFVQVMSKHCMWIYEVKNIYWKTTAEKPQHPHDHIICAHLKSVAYT